ncbi:hypothetical protein GGD61_007685 [Bradyrhizobium sp. SBR1B]|nr:hypothetical protein [Bradyrhizobium sp. SBR1B]
MLAAIKWNSRYSAREWAMMAVALVVRTQANRQNGERKQESHPGSISTKPIIGTREFLSARLADIQSASPTIGDRLLARLIGRVAYPRVHRIVGPDKSFGLA